MGTQILKYPINSRFYLNASGGTIIGPNVNTVEISESILIPANTMINNSIMQLLFRVVKSDPSTTTFQCYIYKNTSNSLVGATLLGTVDSGSTSKTYKTNAQKFIHYQSSNLIVIDNSSAVIADFTSSTGGAPISISFNSAINNYIIIAVGASSLTSTSQVTFCKLDINA